MTSLRLRTAGPEDAEGIAELHADSWRRHYRGAYADSFLDGDVVTDRRSVWTSRLAAPADSATIIAENGTEFAGFVHVILDNDDQWGSLIDNLHVSYRLKRSGLGTALISEAAKIITERAAGNAMYLWVLEQNTAAQGFYRAVGGTPVENALVPSPGGKPERLNGTPRCIRFAWPDGTVVGNEPGDR